MNFNVATVSVKASTYRIHFWHMNKDDAINIMNNSNLKEGCVINFFIIYKK